MADREKEWIDRLAKAKSLGGEQRYILVQTGRGKVEVAVRSELAPLLKIGDWAIVTLSPRQFVIWSEMFKTIIEHAQKKHKPSPGGKDKAGTAVFQGEVMSRQEYSTETFFGKYESLIGEQVGKELDGFDRLLHDIGNDCLVKLFNLEYKEEGLTTDDLLQGDAQQRCKILSAILYDDALWRLEAAYLMICIGLLNVAYANLRESLEALITAFIVERVDAQAIKFLKGEKVDQRLIAKYINPDYNRWLKDMKKAFSNWGVHTKFESVQLTSLFGPGRFDKIVAEVPKVNRPLKLRDGFVDAASRCIKQGGDLSILFGWLMNIPVRS